MYQRRELKLWIFPGSPSYGRQFCSHLCSASECGRCVPAVQLHYCQLLPSTDITLFHWYYELVRLPERYIIPHRLQACERYFTGTRSGSPEFPLAPFDILPRSQISPGPYNLAKAVIRVLPAPK